MIASFARELDEFSVAVQIRLERQTHKGSFLVVEGSTDIDRLAAFVDDIECSIVNAYGRDNAIKSLQIARSRGENDIIAVVDADFHNIENPPDVNDNIIVSDLHDFDLEWVTQRGLAAYLQQVADIGKVTAVGGAESVRLLLMEGLRPLSVLRYISWKGWSLKLKDLDFKNLFRSWRIYITEMIDEVERHNKIRPERLVTLQKEILDNLPVLDDLGQITNGHDFCSALGLSLQAEIGSRENDQCLGTEVEKHFRLIYSVLDFVGSSLCRRIFVWEQSNTPYIVLSSECRRHIAA